MRQEYWIVFLATVMCIGAVGAELDRPQIIKTGTIDVDVVEAHNFVWKGRLLRENWCKAKYKGERGRILRSRMPRPATWWHR